MKRTKITEKRNGWDTETKALIRAAGRYRKRYGNQPRIIKAMHSKKRWRWLVQVPD